MEQKINCMWSEKVPDNLQDFQVCFFCSLSKVT